jgi:anti-anti-sigma regulatory factor
MNDVKIKTNQDTGRIENQFQNDGYAFGYYEIVTKKVNCLAFIVNGYIGEYSSNSDTWSSNTSLITDGVQRAIEYGYHNIVIVLSKQINWYQGTGPGFLIQLNKDLQSVNGKLVVADPANNIKHACDLLGISAFISVVDSIDEAVEAF